MLVRFVNDNILLVVVGCWIFAILVLGFRMPRGRGRF